MGLFGLFSLKSKNDRGAARLPLNVLYVVDSNGLTTEDYFALRNTITRAAPTDFEFLNPGTFVIYFPGTEEGMARAKQLAEELRAFASQRKLSEFGIGSALGPCLVCVGSDGRFTTRPVGDTITRAMHSAISEAKKENTSLAL